jgi:hypothetical protein
VRYLDSVSRSLAPVTTLPRHGAPGGKRRERIQLRDCMSHRAILSNARPRRRKTYWKHTSSKRQDETHVGDASEQANKMPRRALGLCYPHPSFRSNRVRTPAAVEHRYRYRASSHSPAKGGDDPDQRTAIVTTLLGVALINARTGTAFPGGTSCGILIVICHIPMEPGARPEY